MFNHRTPPFPHIFVILVAFLFLIAGTVRAQSNGAASTAFRVGERITYTISFSNYSDIGYAEAYVASRGALAGKDAVELRSKLRTLNLVSAAFFEVDELRTVFADPTTGVPLYSKVVRNPDGMPSETVTDHLKEPTGALDLLTLIYRIRQSSGSGSANLFENGKIYTVTFAPKGTETVKTPAGDFDTSIIYLQSDYFKELGFKEVIVNLSNDEAKLPALIRLRSKQNELRGMMASIQTQLPEPDVTPGPTPAPTIPPMPTPTPIRTPEPYVDNEPLSTDLSFELGEALEYKITAGGKAVGSFVMHAKERKNIGERDTLVLAVTATNAVAGNPIIQANDSVTAFVDPESLAPRQLEINLRGALSSLNQTTIFDPRTGSITYKGNNRVDAPVGTHSILSLIYAMRSFNLRMSKTRDNPVNDTRVAVFWESQPYIFKLRPSSEETIEVNGSEVLAQPISVTTDNPQLDTLGLKIWLSVDGRRVPLRFAVGAYQADLVSVANISPK